MFMFSLYTLVPFTTQIMTTSIISPSEIKHNFLHENKIEIIFNFHHVLAM